MTKRLVRLLPAASSALLLVATIVRVPAASAAEAYSSSVSTYYTAVTCPTAEACVAVGTKQVDRKTASGQLLGGSFTAIAARSADGGKTWSALTVPGSGIGLNGISCWSADECVAVGATEVVAHGSWSPVDAVVVRLSGSAVERVRALPPSALALDAVSCPTQTTCVAVGGSSVPGTITLRPEVLVSRGQATSWASSPLPTANGELQGVSCTGASHCVAVGVVTYTTSGSFSTSTSRPMALVTSSGARSWRPASIPAGSAARGLRGGGPDAVSCTSSARCTAVGDNFDWCQCGTGTPGRYAESWTTLNGGQTWAAHSLPTVEGYDIWYANSISCWGPNTCEMAGTGTTTKPGSLYYAVMVPLAAASGGVAGAVTTSASGLRPQYVNALFCHDAADCVAAGQNWAKPASATIETSSGGKWATTYTAG